MDRTLTRPEPTRAHDKWICSFASFRTWRPYSRLAALSVCATVASVGVDCCSPWPLKIVVDSVLGSRPLPAVLHDRLGSADRATRPRPRGAGRPHFTLLVNGLSVAMSYVNTDSNRDHP
jgi:hypothetical protein